MELRAVDEALAQLTHEVYAKITGLIAIIDNPFASRTLIECKQIELDVWKKVRKLMLMKYLTREPQ